MSEEIWKPPGGPLKDDQRVAGIRKLLDGASPTVRRATISLALHADLEAARDAYTRAYNADERYKADLIRTNGLAVKRSADHLAAALDVGTALLELAALLVQVTHEADSRADVLKLVMGQLAAVCGPWKDVPAGLESGAGLSGYDDADGVARAKASAVRLHEQYVAYGKRKPRES